MSDSNPDVQTAATVGVGVGEQRMTTPQASAPQKPIGSGAVVFRASNLDFFYGRARAAPEPPKNAVLALRHLKGDPDLPIYRLQAA